MPRSTRAELRELRTEAMARDGGCVWPGCQTHLYPASPIATLQMAHLSHRGMGGSREANTIENVVTLCRLHHDVFDGRDGIGNTHREIARMLRTVTGIF